MSHRATRATLLLLFLLFAALACHRPRERPSLDSPATAPTSAAPRDGGTLRIAMASDLLTLDPALANDADSIATLELTLDTLVGYATDSATLEPHLASGYTVSPDGRTYRFLLRPEARFADGTPVTSADVKASIERILAPATASPGAAFFADVAAIATPSSREIDFSLAAPSVSFPYRLAMKFAAPQPGGRPPDHFQPSATGPFRLVRVEPDRRVELARNPSYWCLAANVPTCRGLPHLDRVLIDLAESPATQLLRLRSGELDVVTDVPHADAVELLTHGLPGLRVTTGLALATSEVVLDTAVPPLDDATVRQALNLAISKDRLRTIAAGLLTPTTSVLPPGIDGYDGNVSAPYPYDPSAARALLAAHGHAGFALEIAAAEPSIIVDELVADLRAIGVEASVRIYAPSVFFTLLGQRGRLQAAYASYAADYPAADDLFEAELSSARGIGPDATNWSFFHSPELDALLERARGERNRAARRALYAKAESIVRDAAPWIFLGSERAIAVASERVHDAPIHPVWQREYRATWIDPPTAGARP